MATPGLQFSTTSNPQEFEYQRLMGLPYRTAAQQKRLAELSQLFAGTNYTPSIPSQIKPKTSVYEFGKMAKPSVATISETESVATQPQQVASANPYDKFFKNTQYKTDLLASKMGDIQAYKGQAAANLGLTGLNAIMGLGQMIGGRKVMKGLNAPKYPEEMLPNQQLATRLAQAQEAAQIADPVIRERLLTDLANQKMLQEQQAKVASGGDIASYGALSQATAGSNIKALRDIAAQQTADKLQSQQVVGQLIARKMAEDRARYLDKLAKFQDVDLPEYQARRGYGEALVNKGLTNLLASVKSGSGLTAPMIQSKSAQQGIVNQLQRLSAEDQAKILAQYPSLAKLMKSSGSKSAASVTDKDAKQIGSALAEITAPKAIPTELGVQTPWYWNALGK